MTHGTRAGRAAGCKSRAMCPEPISCSETASRAAGDWQFAKLLDAGLTGAEANAELERRAAAAAPVVEKAMTERERERRAIANEKRRAREATPREWSGQHGGRRGVDTKNCLTDEACPQYALGKTTCRQAYNAEQRRMYAARRANGAKK